MQINESIENYLECILVLQRRHGSARSVDIATQLGVTKPSVSHATKLLRENGYITMEPGGILLTQSGMEIAERIYERHVKLARFLMSLGVSEEVALKDACKIEHDISKESFDAICAFAERRGIGNGE